MRILVATDGSEAAHRAVDYAARLAKALKSELAIIHVISVDNLPMNKLGDYSIGEHISLGDALNTFAQEKLAAAKSQAEALGVKVVRSDSPFGDVAQTIIDTAKEMDAGMIVMGKRGHGRFAGMLMGSVSQKVVSAASCAVTVVP